MIHIIELVIPFFLVIGFGHFATRRGYLDQTGIAALTGFTYWVALPALLISSTAKGHANHIATTASLYLGCCLLVFFVAMAFSRLVWGHSLERAALFALNSTYGNVIFLGTPLVASVYGQEGVQLIVAIIALHSGVLLPLAAVFIEVGARRPGGAYSVTLTTAKNLATNPVIMSIVLGLLWREMRLPVPFVLQNLFSLLAPAAPPLALFCLGASLPSAQSASSTLCEAAVASFCKLILLPVGVGCLSALLGISGLPWHVALLTAAMPTGANAFLLARRATRFAETSAATVVLASCASIITISVLLRWTTFIS